MTKNTFLLLICTIIFTSNSFSQSLKESDLIGSWSPKNLDIDLNEFDQVDEDSNKVVLMGFKMFHNSKFIFNEDHSFNIITEFTEMEDAMLRGKWQFNKETSLISISNDNELLMDISVEYTNNKFYFSIEETPFVLIVEK